MVSSVNNKDLPETSLEKEKHRENSPRQTRATRKVAALSKRSEIKKQAQDLSGKIIWQRKSGVQGSGSGKGKKKGSSLSPVVMEVVLGTLQNAIPNVDELRRKRQEDALKCGRIPRTIGEAPAMSVRQHSNASASNDNTLKCTQTTSSFQSPRTIEKMPTTTLSTGEGL